MRQFNTPAGEVHSLRFAPDGESIYFVSNERYAFFTGAGLIGSVSARPELGLPDFGSMLADFGSILADSRLYQRAFRISTRSGAITGNWPFSGSDLATFAPDLRSVYHSVSVAVAGGDFDLRHTDLLTGKSQGVRELNVRGLSCLAMTPNGHILAAGGYGEHVHRLDVWHNAELDPIPFEASCMAYTPNGRFLATGNRSDGVRVWLGKSLAAQWTEPAAELAWSQDGVLAWGKSNRVAIARPDSEEPVRVWTGIDDELWALTFSPDGRLLLVGTRGGQCVFHDPAAGQQRTVFEWGIGTVHSVAFSPDGLTCAAGGEKGQVVIWDVDS
jgi:WD40 repeat protein